MNLKTHKINDTVPSEQLVEDICGKLGLNKKLVELLILRGYDNVDAVNVFLHPDPANFYPPEQMQGLKECCERLEYAIENDEKVVVYGDYDADGICASSILSLYLSSRGLNVYTHIPDRVGEGYGLSVESIENIIESVMPDLILTCDCGISAVKEVSHAAELGVEVIVTDHHEVGSELPDCIVVNPHRKDCKYPFKDLCGAGVALKIVQAMDKEAAAQYYDLAAIATVADLVDLRDENRLIVQLGLAQMPHSKNFGIIALMNALKLKTVTSSDIAFKIAPRINAAGRMGSAYRAFELFTSSDPDIVSDRLNQILSANIERKQLCDDLYEQAIDLLRKEDLINNRAIIITSDNWEKGITGILAARLVGDFKRPVFILVKNNDEYKGTCRSIEGVNIFELLNHNGDLLKEYGGHNQAAGFTIVPENIAEFKRRILEELSQIDIEMFIPTIDYDMELSENEVTKEFAASLELLEPTGNNGNPKPLFLTRTSSLTATPLKNNSAHTILKSAGGLQFFAYNSYKLNTYYSGVAEREMVYEMADNDYSPRLYLRGCSVDRLRVNDMLARAGFIRMLNYPKCPNVEYSEYSPEEIHSLIDNKFGILIIAGCKATYDAFAENNFDNVVLHEIFDETAANVYTRLIVSPTLSKTLMLSNYSRVIFLDYPPSLNVVGHINKKTKAEVFLPRIDNRKQIFDGVKTDRATFGQYYNMFKSAGAVNVPNVFALYKALRVKSPFAELPQFIFCLSVFTQIGLFAFAPGRGVLHMQGGAKLEESEIFRTVKEIIGE